MALRTIVKISNITNLSDARYCAGMGVDFLGFSMDTLPVERFKEIRQWLVGVEIIGETSAVNHQEIIEKKTTFQPDFIQVNQEIQQEKYWLKIDMDGQSTEALETQMRAVSGVGYFLLENSDPFARITGNILETIDYLAFRYPVILGFGVTETNILELLDELPIRGVALNGGTETRPGFNDFGEMMNILERLETD